MYHWGPMMFSICMSVFVIEIYILSLVQVSAIDEEHHNDIVYGIAG